MKSNFDDQLKNLLQEHPDPSEPLPGHEERFEIRLLRIKDERTIRRLPRWPWIALAAATVAGFIIAIVAGEIKQTNQIAASMKLSEVSQEMAEVEQFYNQRINVDFNSLNKEDVRIQRFMSDMKKLEDEYASLEKELAMNYSNERVVKAMISNYQFRLRIMEHLQKYIEIQNKINSNSHENEPVS